MAEENTMTEENKKTIIAFIAGLLVGGLLVFIFWNPTPASEQPAPEDSDQVEETDETNDNEEDSEEDEVENPNTSTPENNSSVSGGEVEVDDQKAGSIVVFTGADFPVAEGWVAVRDYANGQLGDILGAARWNKLTALLPSSVRLLRPTTAGNEYAIVFYTENGDRVFSLATDVQMSSVMETFKAE
jgi:hypothetical protein